MSSTTEVLRVEGRSKTGHKNRNITDSQGDVNSGLASRFAVVPYERQAGKKKNLKEANQVFNPVRISSAAVAQTGRARKRNRQRQSHEDNGSLMVGETEDPVVAGGYPGSRWYPANSNPVRVGTRADEIPARGTTLLYL